MTARLGSRNLNVFAAVSIWEAVAVQSLHLRSPEGPTHVAPKSPGGPSALKILCPETKKTGTKLPGASWFDATGTVPSPEELVASCSRAAFPGSPFSLDGSVIEMAQRLKAKAPAATRAADGSF